MRVPPPADIAAAKRLYVRTLTRSRASFCWSVDRYRVHHERQFWRLLKAAPTWVTATLRNLFVHFSAYFSASGPEPLPSVVREAVAAASFSPFSREEVVEGLRRMASHKTCGTALYSADLLRGAGDQSLYDCVASLFTVFASSKYPASLNRMLLLPLYKGKGARTAALSYRPISLIHPLGRWYAVCLTSRLEGATSHLRAEGQAGFRAGYRVEDNVAIL